MREKNSARIILLHQNAYPSKYQNIDIFVGLARKKEEKKRTDLLAADPLRMQDEELRQNQLSMVKQANSTKTFKVRVG